MQKEKPNSTVKIFLIFTFMALTKKDIETISKLFNDGLTLMVIPSLTRLLESEGKVDGRLDAIDGRLDSMDGRLDAMDKSIKGIKRRIDSSVLRADKHHKETMETIGKYYYDTTTKEEFNLLEGRVKKLELAYS